MDQAREIPSEAYGVDAFARQDETDDRHFYRNEKPGPHLDARALEAVERIIGPFIVESEPRILDLMAGPDSHLPKSLSPSFVWSA